MAFLRKQTSEGSVAVLYSLIQKCIRRGLEEESLYYSEILEILNKWNIQFKNENMLKRINKLIEIIN